MKINLAQIQKDTLSICFSNEKLKKSIEYSQQNTKLYDESTKFVPKIQKSTKYNISISKYRTFQSVKNIFSNKTLKTCVLNFANAYNPGGGALYGARAQEESLCRTSTLYPCLKTDYLIENYYQYHNKLYEETNRLFYVPKIIVFKTDETYPRLMNENEWYEVDVITCAAHNQGEDYLNDKTLFNVNCERITQILGCAIENNVDNIVLGAFGCGAFANDPKIISQAFKNVLIDQQFFKFFVNVHFAIFCAKYETENFVEFKKTFQDFLIEIESVNEEKINENIEKNKNINDVKKEDLKKSKDEKKEEKIIIKIIQ